MTLQSSSDEELLTRIQTAAIALYMRSEVRKVSCEKHLRNISHMHMCMRAHTQTCTQAYAYMLKHMSTCRHACMSMYMHTPAPCTRSCTHTHCMHVCTHVRAHTCAHMYTCLHTHIKTALQLLGGTVSHTSDGQKFQSPLSSCHCVCA